MNKEKGKRKRKEKKEREKKNRENKSERPTTPGRNYAAAISLLITANILVFVASSALIAFASSDLPRPSDSNCVKNLFLS